MTVFPLIIGLIHKTVPAGRDKEFPENNSGQAGQPEKFMPGPFQF